MNQLLIAATAKEIAPFLKAYKKNKSFESIDILITGIGLTSIAYHLTKQLHLKKYNLVVQAGVAGCFDRNTKLGTVFAVKKEVIADLSVVEMNELKTIFELQLTPQNRFPYQRGWLINNNNAGLKKANIPLATGITVNEITTDLKKQNFYTKKFKPMVESMEGAALHYVCLMENIPFIQLRSVSNYLGERNKKKWNLTTSIKNLNTTLIQILRNN